MLHAVTITILGYVVTALALFLGWRYMEYRRRIRAVKATGVPVVAQFVDYLHLLAPVLRLKYTRDFWRIAPETFTALNTPILAMVSSTSTSYHISEAALFKEVCVTRRRNFPKAIHLYDALRIFGDNVVTTNDHVWRRHRAAATQAFSDANNRLVLDTTIVMVARMMSKWEERTDGGAASVLVLEEITRLTLANITRAAFGMSLDDTEQGSSASRHGMKYKLPFSTCMELVSMHTLPRLLLPRWAFHIPLFTLPQIGTAFKEFDCYLLDVIDAKRREMTRASTAANETITTNTSNVSSTTTTATTGSFEGAGSEDDDNTRSGSGAKGSNKGQSLLSLLVEAASDAHDPSKRLEERELLGNAFIFLLAGHETSAHALSFALNLLALNPDKQEQLYEEVSYVIGAETTPTYEDLDKLVYCHGVMNEALRLFPPVVLIPKTAAHTTDIVAADGTKYTVKEGCNVNLHVWSLHRNSAHYRRPHSFVPERWVPRALHHRKRSSMAVDRGASQGVERDGGDGGGGGGGEEADTERRHTGASSRGQDTVGQAAMAAEAEIRGHGHAAGVGFGAGGEDVRSEDDDDEIDHFAFAPFSLGERSCIGRKFAEITILATLAMLVQRFRIEVPPGVSEDELLASKALLTLYPANRCPLLFKTRSA